MTRTPRGYVTAASELSGQSLEAFMSKQRPSHKQIKAWFDERPGVLEQMLEGFSQFSTHMIHRWLKETYAYPFSVTTIDGFRQPTR